VLIVAFMAFEVVVAILAHSLALLSDAAHATDAGARARFCHPVGRSAVGRPAHRAAPKSQRSGQQRDLFVLGILVITK
jgi:hypothetical protein